MDFKESESTVFCADFRLYKHICIFLGKESISFISIPSFKSLPLNPRNLGVLALKLWQGPHLCPLRLQLLPWTVRGLGKRPLGLLSRVWICPGSPWSSPPPQTLFLLAFWQEVPLSFAKFRVIPPQSSPRRPRHRMSHLAIGKGLPELAMRVARSSR